MCGYNTTCNPDQACTAYCLVARQAQPFQLESIKQFCLSCLCKAGYNIPAAVCITAIKLSPVGAINNCAECVKLIQRVFELKSTNVHCT